MTSDPKSKQPRGTLYVVATPIGNLSDLTERACATLKAVDIIACEDTRHTQKLLQHLGIKKPLMSYHQHNEHERTQTLLDQLGSGHSLALVCDAGTPLISDPGFVLVKAVREAGFDVSPVPGASAMITALSASGLATDRFTFEGFLPHKTGAKRDKLEALVDEPRTLVFYEAKHRIIETLTLMHDVLGDRTVCVARELTKTFETFYDGCFSDVLKRMQNDEMATKGEFVVMVSGVQAIKEQTEINADLLFKRLLDELPPKKAAGVLADLTAQSKKVWYDKALALKGE